MLQPYSHMTVTIHTPTLAQQCPFVKSRPTGSPTRSRTAVAAAQCRHPAQELAPQEAHELPPAMLVLEPSPPLLKVANLESSRCAPGASQFGQTVGSSALPKLRSSSNLHWHWSHTYSYRGIALTPCSVLNSRYLSLTVLGGTILYCTAAKPQNPGVCVLERQQVRTAARPGMLIGGSP